MLKKEYLEDGDDRVINYDTALITGGFVDSFSMVSLKVFLETKYNISIRMKKQPLKHLTV